MKKEPCVRFGMRISPKISEKPAESRKRRPPSVMLLTASTSQRLMAVERRSALQGWIVTRVHRLGQEPLLVVGPELAHLRVRLDRGVEEPVALPLAAANVEAAHDVAEVVEGERPPRGVGERHRAQRPVHGFPVVGLATRLLER